MIQVFLRKGEAGPVGRREGGGDREEEDSVCSSNKPTNQFLLVKARGQGGGAKAGHTEERGRRERERERELHTSGVVGRGFCWT